MLIVFYYIDFFSFHSTVFLLNLHCPSNIARSLVAGAEFHLLVDQTMVQQYLSKLRQLALSLHKYEILC